MDPPALMIMDYIASRFSKRWRASSADIHDFKTYIAIDLDAGSGRVIAATTDFSRLELEVPHRFDNPGTDPPGGLIGVGIARLMGPTRSKNTLGTSGCETTITLTQINHEILRPPHH